MLIRNKKKFALGMGMMISFFAVLFLMFTPVFGGMNAFHAADGLFNSISKASTNYFESTRAQVDAAALPVLDKKLNIANEATGQSMASQLTTAGLQSEYADGVLTVQGDLKMLLFRFIDDSKLMYNNEGDAVQAAYGLDHKRVLYNWYQLGGEMVKSYNKGEEFDTAKLIDTVRSKTVEVGYNYYGVKPTPPSERIGIMSFSMVFYVFYTMWWGFAIFYLCEGLGMLMTKTAKKEA